MQVRVVPRAHRGAAVLVPAGPAVAQFGGTALPWLTGAVVSHVDLD